VSHSQFCTTNLIAITEHIFDMVRIQKVLPMSWVMNPRPTAYSIFPGTQETSQKKFIQKAIVLNPHL
jgi:hypothetical protein